MVVVLAIAAMVGALGCAFEGGKEEGDAGDGDGGTPDARPAFDAAAPDGGVDPFDCPPDVPVMMFHSCTPPLEMGSLADICTPDVTDCGEGYTCEDCAAAACCYCAACLPACIFTGPAQGPLPEYMKLRTSYGNAGEAQEIIVQGFPFYIGALFYLARIGDSEELPESSYPDSCSLGFSAPARAAGIYPVWVSQYGGNEPWVLAGFFSYMTEGYPSCVQPGFPCGDTQVCCETTDVPMACVAGRCRME